MENTPNPCGCTHTHTHTHTHKYLLTDKKLENITSNSNVICGIRKYKRERSIEIYFFLSFCVLFYITKEKKKGEKI